MFSRAPHTEYRELGSLSKQAGCPTEQLRRMVFKEAVDNALDAGHTVAGRSEDGAYFIENAGHTLPANADEIAVLFSTGRPRTSSKVDRLPARGALGNGLRVLTGAVQATGGTLVVTSHRIRHEIIPQDDGTSVVHSEPAPDVDCTRVEYTLGDALPEDDDDTAWGDLAIDVACGGTFYRGKPSPWFFDEDSWFELCEAASHDMTVHMFISRFDGCTGTTAGALASPYKGRSVKSLSRIEAGALLLAARARAKRVRPARLGVIGADNHLLPSSYGRAEGEITIAAGRGGLSALVPFRVEAWAEKIANTSKSTIRCLVNRTPAAADLTARTQLHGGKRWLFLWGPNNLHFGVAAGKAEYAITLHISTPCMPITSDGKEPNLKLFQPQIIAAIKKAVRVARHSAGPDRVGQTKSKLNECTRKNLSAAIAFASGNGSTRFSQRQLFYALRPYYLREVGTEPSWGWYCAIITKIEGTKNAIAGMTRDNRGTLYIPHERTEIPLGTLTVEEYKHKKWGFRCVLYCEKEGLNQVLRACDWPERHDCALMTGKGFASRAVRDLIDLMGDSGDEQIVFFCIHDGDSFGTMIYEKLQHATAARDARKVKIINLGLEPWEALEMGLQVETFKKKDKSASVANYVYDRIESHPDELDWPRWLQTNRVELNAMSGPDFVKWITAKFEAHKPGKVMPPEPVLRGTVEQELKAEIVRRLTEEAIRQANVDGRAAELVAKAMSASDAVGLRRRVQGDLKKNPVRLWRDPLRHYAKGLAEKVLPANRGLR